MSDISPPFEPYPTALTQATADTLYVNVTGDEVTGGLTVNGLIAAGTGVALPEGEPSGPGRAARRDYIDAAVATATAAPARWT